MTKPRVYIICGVHNGLKYTQGLLSCLKKQNYKEVKTIIIDDGSTDDTFKYLARRKPPFKILRGDGSLWWTGAVYWGVEEALKDAKSNDYILTINNDCTFNNTYISDLVTSSQKNGGAIVGSLAIDAKNKKEIWDGGITIDWKRALFVAKSYKNIDDLPSNRKYDESIDTLSTKGTLYPVEVFKKIGNFNKKKLPHYLSDYEFACRAKRYGFKLVLSYQAIVYNDIERTGMGDSMPKIITYSKLWQFYFDRKSKLNIIDNYYFINLCFPLKYKPLNYLFLLMKFFYLLSFTFPFVIFRPFILFTKKLIISNEKPL